MSDIRSRSFAGSIVAGFVALVGANLAPLSYAVTTSAPSVPALLANGKTDYAAEADEVTRAIQRDFGLGHDGLFAHARTKRSPEFMWGDGILFSALVAGARHDPVRYARPMAQLFDGLERFWDSKSPIPGYEPAPTAGNGHDKYYDDNAWMVICFAEAYQQTREGKYLSRAQQVLDFVLSGWDDKAGGGIWWHEEHKDHSKNTCVNAPAAVGCLRMALFSPPAVAGKDIAMAKKIVEWTNKTLEANDGLYNDRIKVETGHIQAGKLTYNAALMIRADLGLYRATGQADYLKEATRTSNAADWFLDPKTHAYRDKLKWSHLQVEADLEMYRATGDEPVLKRAIDNADYEYSLFKTNPPDEVIDVAAIARTLWLMSDMQSPAGLKFWATVEQVGK